MQCPRRDGGLPCHAGPFTERCLYCGQLPSECPQVWADSEHEPRCITGDGPQGYVKGPGRGPVNDADLRRLWFYCLYVRDGDQP